MHPLLSPSGWTILPGHSVVRKNESNRCPVVADQGEKAFAKGREDPPGVVRWEEAGWIQLLEAGPVENPLFCPDEVLASAQG